MVADDATSAERATDFCFLLETVAGIEGPGRALAPIVAVDVALCSNVGEGVMVLPTDDVEVDVDVGAEVGTVVVLDVGAEVGTEVDEEGAEVDVEGAEVGAVVEVDVDVDGVVDNSCSCSFAIAAGLGTIWAALSLVPHEPLFESED